MLQRLIGFFCLLALLASLGGSVTAAPDGFDNQIVPGLNDLAQPTALAFTPDGRLLITSKPGRLYVYKDGQLLDPPALSINSRLCTDSEQGLLGVVADPAFAENNFIYIYYTARRGDRCTSRDRENDPVNRVARYTLGSDNIARDETILIDMIPSPNGNHNAGDLHFGKDGYLYVSVGDGGWDYDGGGEAGNNDAARDTHTLLGKILRITRDGAIPAANPFQGANSARCYDPAEGGNKSGFTEPGKYCQETFAWGLRNPYRIAFDPNAAGTRFFINDVGQNRSEEISEGVAGADYGWNCREGSLENNTGGPCNPTPPNMRDPIFEYQRNPIPDGQPDFFNGCNSITAGAFVPNGLWPAAYDNGYLFADYVCGRVFLISPDGGSYTPSLFLDASRITHMVFGPHEDGQALYFTDYFGGDVRRLVYTGSANRSPTAAFSATPTAGPGPLTVAFDGSASSDPDTGDSIAAYLWDFGDGATTETAGATTSHTYTQEGVFTARLRVRDSNGALSPVAATVRIDVGNNPPVPQITAPDVSFRYSVGQEITLTGAATDPEDGQLPGDALSWDIRIVHDEHEHPLRTADGASVTITAPGPEDLAAISNSYLSVRLTATDSDGRSTTVTGALRPKVVNLSFRTLPSGLRVTIEGGGVRRTVTTPHTQPSWPGYALALSIPAGQTSGGAAVRFCHWVHGGAASQTLVTPAAGALYVAVFAREGEQCPTDGTPGDERAYLPLVVR